MIEIYDYIIDVLKTNQFAQGGFVISILMAVGLQLKKLPELIWSRIERLLIYKVNIEEIDDLFLYFEVWLSINHKRKYRNVEAALSISKNSYDEVSKEISEIFNEKVIYKQFDDTFYIRRGLFIIKIFKGREKLENASSLKSAFYNKYRISGFFAKKTINKLIEEVHVYSLEMKNELKKSKLLVKTSTQWGEWMNESIIEPKDIDNVIIEGKKELLDDIKLFISNRDWYKKRGIVYKRGYMFHGVAGTGKTSLVLSIAKELKRNINFLQISGMDDHSLRTAFRNLSPDSILVMEDVDAVFKKREDGSKNIKFTFSTLLNCLDGVFSKENIITIFTTNHKELLDDALIRTGRIDYKMEFKNPNINMVIEFLDRFYETNTKTTTTSYDNNLSMSEVQDICLKSKNSEEALTKILKS